MSHAVLLATTTSASLLNVVPSKATSSGAIKPLNLDGVRCAAWVSDGNAIVGLQNGRVERLDQFTGKTEKLYTLSEPVVAIVVRETQVIIGGASKLVALNASTGKVVNLGIRISGVLKSLALSPDKEYLCMLMETSALIHHFATNVQTTLVFQQLSLPITSVAFLPLKRVVLAVACGNQLLLYDIAKQNALIKTLELETAERIIDLAYSTSTRGSLLLATFEGYIYGFDMEKDKLTRFDAKLGEGVKSIASLGLGYVVAGTTGGHISLLQEGATTLHPLKQLEGECVHLVSTQRKLSITRAVPVATRGTSATRKQPLTDANPRTSATAPRKASAELEAAKVTRLRQKPSQGSIPGSPMQTRKQMSRQASGLSQADVDKPMTPISSAASPLARRAPSIRTASPRSSNASSPANSPTVKLSATGASHSGQKPVNVASRRSSSTTSKAAGDQSTNPDLPGVSEVSAIFNARCSTPPGRQHSVERGSITPILAIDLGDSPPSSRPRKSTVSFSFHQDKENEPNTTIDKRQKVAPKQKTIQRQPTRGITPSKRNPIDNVLAAESMQVSPLRSPARPQIPQSTDIKEFIQSVVKEAMREREEEQREELRALHLDVVKMGRMWKNELRTLMEEYVGDFKQLHQENERLRAENERLRRGY